MDDLDYSKHLKSLFQFAIAKGANASSVATRMFICFNMAWKNCFCLAESFQFSRKHNSCHDFNVSLCRFIQRWPRLILVNCVDC